MERPGKTQRWRNLTGLVVLAACTGALYFLAAGEAIAAAAGLSLVAAGGVALWLAGILTAARWEWPVARAGGSAERRFSMPRDGSAFAAVVLGAVATFVISVDLGLGPVVASALAGVVAALVARPVAVPFFCGSFVGMASPHLFGYEGIVLAGCVAGVVYLMCVGVFSGFGGKLGTTALIGCIGAAVVLGTPFLPGSAPTEAIPNLLAVLIPWSVFGALGTFVLHTRLPGGPVLASGVVGLLGGFLLPVIYGVEVGGIAALTVFSASFAGMSSRQRCPRYREMVLAGVLCAVVLVYGAPFFGGAGGKLGAAAFGAVTGTRGLAVLGAVLDRGVRRAWRAGRHLSG